MYILRSQSKRNFLLMQCQSNARKSRGGGIIFVLDFKSDCIRRQIEPASSSLKYDFERLRWCLKCELTFFWILTWSSIGHSNPTRKKRGSSQFRVQWWVKNFSNSNSSFDLPKQNPVITLVRLSREKPEIHSLINQCARPSAGS